MDHATRDGTSRPPHRGTPNLTKRDRIGLRPRSAPVWEVVVGGHTGGSVTFSLVKNRTFIEPGIVSALAHSGLRRHEDGSELLRRGPALERHREAHLLINAFRIPGAPPRRPRRNRRCPDPRIPRRRSDGFVRPCRSDPVAAVGCSGSECPAGGRGACQERAPSPRLPAVGGLAPAGRLGISQVNQARIRCGE